MSEIDNNEGEALRARDLDAAEGTEWGVTTNRQTTAIPRRPTTPGLPGITAQVTTGAVTTRTGNRALPLPAFTYNIPSYVEQLTTFVRNGGDRLIATSIQEDHWEILSAQVSETLEHAQTEPLEPAVEGLQPISRDLGNAEFVQRLVAMTTFQQRVAGGLTEPDINVVITEASDLLVFHAMWMKRLQELRRAKTPLSDEEKLKSLLRLVYNKTLSRFLRRVYTGSVDTFKVLEPTRSWLRRQIANAEDDNAPLLPADVEEQKRRGNKPFEPSRGGGHTGAGKGRPDKRKGGTQPKHKRQNNGASQKCKHCGKPGHTEAQCWLRPGATNVPDWFERKASSAKVCAAMTPDRNSTTVTVALSVDVADDPTKEGQTLSVRCLVDTGAKLSVLHPEMAEWLRGNNAEWQDTSTSVRFADGRQQTATGKVTAWVHSAVNGRHTMFKVVFVVMALPTYRCVLAGDVATGAGLLSVHVQNFDQSVARTRPLRLSETQVPLYEHSELDEVCTIQMETSDYLSDIPIHMDDDTPTSHDAPHKHSATQGGGHSSIAVGEQCDPDTLDIPVRAELGTPVQMLCALAPENTDNGTHEPRPKWQDEIQFSDDVPQVLRQAVLDVMMEYESVFDDTDMTPANVNPVSLDFKVKPDRLQTYFPRLSEEEQKDVKTVIDELREREIITKSDTKFVSPLVLVGKKDGSKRPCVNYVQLNKHLAVPSYPLPTCEAILQSLGGSQWLWQADCRHGYFQIPLDEDSRKYTGFSAGRHGVWEFARLPQGICSSASIFQRCIHEVLGDAVPHAVQSYLDDLVGKADSDAQLLTHLREVLSKLAAHNIKLKPAKFKIGSCLEFLGFTVSRDGVKPTTRYLEGILNVPTPTSAAHVRRLSGLLNFIAKWLPQSAEVMLPITKLASGQQRFSWGEEQATAFKNIKQLVKECNMLYHPDHSRPFYLRSDASSVAIAGWLYQRADDKAIRPLAFYSKALTPTQRRRGIQESECLAIVLCLQRFRQLIGSTRVHLLCDNRNLTFIDQSQNPKLLRYCMVMNEFNYSIQHLPGDMNETADRLSRLFANITYDSRVTSRGDICALTANDMQPHRTESQRRTLIQSVHEASGHVGVHKMCLKLNDMGYHWKGIRKFVTKALKACPICAKCKQVMRPIDVKSTLASWVPWDTLSIDYFGPTREDSAGFKHILVVQDDCTRYTKLFPAKSVNSIEVAHAIYSIVAEHGVPRRIRSDNGPEFTATVIKELIELLGVEHIFSIPYVSRTNSLVERRIGTTTAVVRAMVNQRDLLSHWSLVLPAAQRAVNSMIHTSLGCSPNEALFGNRFDLDRGILHTAEPQRTSTTMSERIQFWQRSQELIIQKAMVIQKRIIDKNTSVQHLGKLPNYQPGQLVMRQWVKQAPSKLHPKMEGPFVVVRQKGSNTYEIRHCLDAKIILESTSRLAPLAQELSPHAESMGRLDSQEWIVEEILEHRIVEAAKDQLRKKSSAMRDYEFYVTWRHFDATHNSWLPYSRLKSNSALDTYLENKQDLRKIFIRTGSPDRK